MLITDKPLLKSSTILGGALSAGSGVAQLLTVLQILQVGIPPIWAATLALTGGIASILGRIRARKKIK